MVFYRTTDLRGCPPGIGHDGRERTAIASGSRGRSKRGGRDRFRPRLLVEQHWTVRLEDAGHPRAKVPKHREFAKRGSRVTPDA
jgi:hypothetical protein